MASPVNMSGKWFNVVSYGVRKQDELLDMATIRETAMAAKPKLIIAGGTAYSRIWDWQAFRAIADEVGAYLMVDMAHIAGLVAGGAHPSPLPWADVVTTTTHKSLRGPRGGMILTNNEDIAKKMNSAVFPGLAGWAVDACDRRQGCRLWRGAAAGVQGLCRGRGGQCPGDGGSVDEGRDQHRVGRDRQPPDAGRSAAQGCDRQGDRAGLGRAHITCNKNGVPFDPEKPFVTTGIRLGTPAGTTRGFGEAEFREIADWIVEVVDGLAANGDAGNEAVEAAVRAKVATLCARFPLYPGL